MRRKEYSYLSVAVRSKVINSTTLQMQGFDNFIYPICLRQIINIFLEFLFSFNKRNNKN